MNNAASAEEYFAIGMAYFDLGKYSEADRTDSGTSVGRFLVLVQTGQTSSVSD
jgi:hypothetical protein